MVSNICYFHPYLGKIPILTNIFQRGSNQQLVVLFVGWTVWEVTLTSQILSGSTGTESLGGSANKWRAWVTLKMFFEVIQAVTILSPSWRSLNLWKGHLTIPKTSLWITWFWCFFLFWGWISEHSWLHNLFPAVIFWHEDPFERVENQIYTRVQWFSGLPYLEQSEKSP